ncbi:hypothetical protein [Micromonospora sp. NPDC005367]|uniref:hypothetical protein n=1 Tax=Micromonospora sp. NPDC005367 TaxID=3155590 RepID=UPI0033A08A72
MPAAPSASTPPTASARQAAVRAAMADMVAEFGADTVRDFLAADLDEQRRHVMAILLDGAPLPR